MKKGELLWGIDLGGTKIEGVILNSAADHKIVSRLRVDTEFEKGYDHVLSRVALIIDKLKKESGAERPQRIGIGTPGVTNPTTGKLKNSNTLCLNGNPVRSDLEKILGMKVKIVNDANCFALAEQKLGAAKGKETVFGIIMGSGVGGGIIAHGQMLAGLHGIAGEWGHNVIEPGGALCYCGKRGCVETVFSGPALEHHYALATGQKKPLKEIAASAKGGEKAAMETLERLRRFFGLALAQLINVLDPDAVVIGGGVGNVDLLYEEATRAEVRKHLFNGDDAFETPILKPKLGDSAGVLGAAML